MDLHEWMIQGNHELIRYGTLPEERGKELVERLLEGRNGGGDIWSPGETSRYPIFYIPPGPKGKKWKTVLGQVPKTQLFSANMYELEILRLLCLLAPDREEVRRMRDKTLNRLRGTCFGYTDDGVGECFDVSLVVLRFLAIAAPEDSEWILSRIDNYNRHREEKKRPWFCLWYFWLCLSELPFHLAQPEIEKYKGEMLNWLTNKSCVMHSETDKTIHPVILCMLRNTLARYPEYEYMKDRQPYIDEKDGRLHFHMAR